MINSLKVLGFCLLMASSLVHAEGVRNDAQAMEEVTKFADENARLRDEHIQQMRELHLKHVNEMYDRKLAHSKEITIMWKQIKPGDKEANKALKNQIEEKWKAFEKEDEQLRKDFKENVLKKKNAEFRESMKGRHKELKGKFKN